MAGAAAYVPEQSSTEQTEPILSLTALAAEQARAAMEREGALAQALRVAVSGGGCSGMQYSLSFDGAQRPDDTVIEQHGVRLLVDATSLPYLRGTLIDYVAGLHGAGFKFSNPNASRSCGCGSSFST